MCYYISYSYYIWKLKAKLTGTGFEILTKITVIILDNYFMGFVKRFFWNISATIYVHETYSIGTHNAPLKTHSEFCMYSTLNPSYSVVR